MFVTHDLEEAIALADKVVVMTAGPGTVKAVYDIDLPRPRGAVQEIRFDPRFLELHHQIWETLRDEVQQAYSRTAVATRAGERRHDRASRSAVRDRLPRPPHADADEQSIAAKRTGCAAAPQATGS